MCCFATQTNPGNHSEDTSSLRNTLIEYRNTSFTNIFRVLRKISHIIPNTYEAKPFARKACIFPVNFKQIQVGVNGGTGGEVKQGFWIGNPPYFCILCVLFLWNIIAVLFLKFKFPLLEFCIQQESKTCKHPKIFIL